MANYVLGIGDPNGWVSKADSIGHEQGQSIL